MISKSRFSFSLRHFKIVLHTIDVVPWYDLKKKTFHTDLLEEDINLRCSYIVYISNSYMHISISVVQMYSTFTYTDCILSQTLVLGLMKLC